MASILSIGRRVYGTLIRFVSPSASTALLRFGTGEGGCDEEHKRRRVTRGEGGDEVAVENTRGRRQDDAGEVSYGN